MYRFLRYLLFLLEPETAHRMVVQLLKWPFVTSVLGSLYRLEHPALQRNLWGISFPNPVGLAAGFDKDAEVFHQMGQLGFGFVEIGTVTPRPQPGNPPPRLFRLVEDEALINRMGFNNRGVKEAVQHLRRRPKSVVVAGNIGKNKDTPNIRAVDDYEFCFRELHPVVDLFVVNVSSPNTPNLRQLQEKDSLLRLLNHLQKVNREFTHRKPILLKIAPDLNESQLDDILEIVQQAELHGIVATNTTTSRKGLSVPPEKIARIGPGGLSGRPLKERSTQIIRYLHQKSGGTLPIIGTGGIHSAEDALEKFRAGASLIELFTGFIYHGPKLIRDILQALIAQSEQVNPPSRSSNR